jgi:hypothetical protein
MGVPVLVMGPSGTGKSTSMRGFPEGSFGLVNVLGKPLPFRGAPTGYVTREAQSALAATMKAKSRSVVVDDFGYLITDTYMRYSYGDEKMRDQFDVYKKIGHDVYGFVNSIVSDTPGDRIVYLMMHTDVDASGNVVPATVGKLLNEKVNLVGMFAIVLLAKLQGGEHVFVTNDELPAKTPMGMFQAQYIDNDLCAVDTAIREYMGLAPLVEEQKKGTKNA